jgi:hypothetical protein
LQLWLYVDDLTVAAAGTSRDALATVAQATDFFINIFEEEFKLEVSCTKSYATASCPRLAVALARSTQRRVLRFSRAAKLLGTPYAGNRRSVKVLKVRLKTFKERTPRIQLLRRYGVNSSQIVRAMGAPGMLYGIDIVGASCTHLQKVRVAALRAALPPGASRNVDIAFSVIDAAGGRLDPAYAAHSTPIKHWGMSWWQGWAPVEDIGEAFSDTIDRLTTIRDAGRSVWSAVAGPVGAVVASAWRIGKMHIGQMLC